MYVLYSSHKGGVIKGLVGSFFPHHKGVVILAPSSSRQPLASVVDHDR